MANPRTRPRTPRHCRRPCLPLSDASQARDRGRSSPSPAALSPLRTPGPAHWSFLDWRRSACRRSQERRGSPHPRRSRQDRAARSLKLPSGWQTKRSHGCFGPWTPPLRCGVSARESLSEGRQVPGARGGRGGSGEPHRPWGGGAAPPRGSHRLRPDSGDPLHLGRMRARHDICKAAVRGPSWLP
jgi:hypothetical protein